MRLPWSDRLLLIRVTLVLAAIRLGLVLLPFQTLRRMLNRTAMWWAPPSTADPAAQTRVAWAVSAVGRRVLGGEACLTEALTAQFLLQRRGVPCHVRIGVTRDERGKIAAHAWVESNGQVVVGGPVSFLTRFQPLPDFDEAVQ